MASSRPRRHTSFISALDDTINHLIVSSLAPASRKQYAREFTRFQTFAANIAGEGRCFPASQQTVARYIAYLFDQKYAASTIRTSLSALSFFHKTVGVEDVCDTFFIKKLLVGAAKLSVSLDMRIPLTTSMLTLLVQAIPSVAPDIYTSCMLQAMMTLAVFALLRISEMTVTSRGTCHALSRSSVSYSSGRLHVTFASFKHSGGRSFTLAISKQMSAICPYRYLRAFLQLRGDAPGFLFVLPGNVPISPNAFNDNLQLIVAAAGLSRLRITSHSFRIGRCTHLAALGFSEHRIKTIGRWRSDAYRRYIHIDALKC